MKQITDCSHAKTQRHKAELRGLAAAAFTASALFLLLLGSAAAQDDAPLLHPGARAAGVIDSSTGDAWRVTVCAGDVATVTLTSADFTPYLEVTGAGDELVASSAAWLRKRYKTSLPWSSGQAVSFCAACSSTLRASSGRSISW